MIRKRLPEGFGIRADFPWSDAAFRKVLPFRRAWIVILVLLVFDVVFTIPAITTYYQVAEAWKEIGNLFDLTSALFLSAWLLGWSMAPLIMTTILFILLFGREVIRANPDVIEIGIGIPGLLLFVPYKASSMRNLRLKVPEEKSGKSWRGQHYVFDYVDKDIDFGSAITNEDLQQLKRQLMLVTGSAMSNGEVTPEELQQRLTVDSPREAAQQKNIHDIEPVADSAVQQPTCLWTPALIVLVVANLVPVFGALYLDWRLGDVMVLYWAESAIIGFYNLCKMVVIDKWLVLVMGPFFLGHFGGFMSIHFLFVYTLFVQGPEHMGSGGDLMEVAGMFYDLWPALAALFVSHGMSFITNFIGRHEYRSKSRKDVMTEPYNRIVFMHLSLIFGGFMALMIGDTAPVILLIIAIKVMLDIRAHRKERWI